MNIEDDPKRNLSMLVDFYEMIMANGYINNNMKDTVAYFDVFFRKIPDNGGFVIAAGLEQIIKYIQNLKFSHKDIEMLKLKNLFSDEFLEYLLNFKFLCDIWSVPEGTPVFPNEPIITVRGPVIQAQMIETMLLLIFNHQSLIATKTNRIVRAAKGKIISEFGSRRAQGPDAAIFGARAAYIGGCNSTACVMAEKIFSIPATGTMGHSWVQMFSDELEAFRAFARLYPKDCILLVDTYSTLNSGVPNAIKIFKEELVPKGYRPIAIRIDSGDITYLSKAARKMLDNEGFSDCKIIASNSLDEKSIACMLSQGAMVDSFGVGERLITAASDPILGCVYKLCAIEKNDKIIPRIKISNNVTKINNPGVKELWRLFDKNTGKAIADVITLSKEIIDNAKPYTIFDPQSPWKKKTLTDFYAVRIRKKIFENGKLIYKSPGINNIKSYCSEQINSLWDEVKRLDLPHTYYVDLSENLWNEKQRLLLESTAQYN